MPMQTALTIVQYIIQPSNWVTLTSCRVRSYNNRQATSIFLSRETPGKVYIFEQKKILFEIQVINIFIFVLELAGYRDV